MKAKDDELPRTLDEFRAWNERQPERYEFIAGVVRAMAPGSNRHSVIKSNIGIAFGMALADKPCRSIIDGPAVESTTQRTHAIPDVLVTCESFDEERGVIDEPVIVVEVLSPSTSSEDMGRKLDLYFSRTSLRHYLVVHQDTCFIHHHERQQDGQFITRLVHDGDMHLDPPGITLNLRAAYQGLALGREP